MSRRTTALRRQINQRFGQIVETKGGGKAYQVSVSQQDLAQLIAERFQLRGKHTSRKMEQLSAKVNKMCGL